MDRFLIDFGSILDRFGIDLGSILDRFWIDFLSIWDRFLMEIGSILDRFWIDLGSIWDRFGVNNRHLTQIDAKISKISFRYYLPKPWRSPGWWLLQEDLYAFSSGHPTCCMQLALWVGAPFPEEGLSGLG